MRITGLDIPEGHIGGLKAIKAEKLGDVVVVAGRNGSGKSRLLQYLFRWQDQSVAGADGPRSIAMTVQRAITSSHAGDWARVPWSRWFADEQGWAVLKRANLRRPLDAFRGHFLALKLSDPGAPNFIHFVPKGLGLADPKHQTKSETESRANSAAQQLGVGNFENVVLSHLQHVQNQWWEASHPNSSVSEKVRKAAISDYEQLQEMLTRFLQARLERSIGGDATLFAKPLGDANLSDGQKILLQFCAAVHTQANRLSDPIILMDEPENHLHPEALLFAINTIRKHLTNGQLWIATHSVHVLANFDPDSIWWMDEGTLTHAGSAPETVLKGLLGDQDNIDRLANFLGLPAAIAVNNFTAQCLQPPGVVATGGDDPQLQQIRATLDRLRVEGQPLSVVDMGAGRGRLISALAATDGPGAAAYDYLAFDPSPTHRQECQDAIARCYPNDPKARWFGSATELRNACNPQSIDVVLMCNVLHEIDPTKWLPELFGATGLVSYLLKPEGFVLIVEDTEMRIGEKAHDLGFLVLDTAHLRRLFGVRDDDTGFVSNRVRDGRLVATLVPAGCLGRATADTLKSTLRDVSHSASMQISELRKSTSPSYRDGRKLAFQMQQFANAELTLKTLGG